MSNRQVKYQPSKRRRRGKPPTKKIKRASLPPPSRMRGILAPVPTSETTPDNMSKPNSGFQYLNFKVDPKDHRNFRVAASLKGMSQKALLLACFQAWLEKYADDEVKAAMKW